MIDDLKGFARWRDNVEARLSTLEVTVETETRLRAEMDADMSDLKVEFRSQRKLLQALADTQSEHTTTLAGHTATLAEHTERLTRLEAGQDRVLAGVETIIGLLDRDPGSRV